jgi:hypothetical protein
MRNASPTASAGILSAHTVSSDSSIAIRCIPASPSAVARTRAADSTRPLASTNAGASVVTERVPRPEGHSWPLSAEGGIGPGIHAGFAGPTRIASPGTPQSSPVHGGSRRRATMGNTCVGKPSVLRSNRRIPPQTIPTSRPESRRSSRCRAPPTILRRRYLRWQASTGNSSVPPAFTRQRRIRLGQSTHPIQKRQWFPSRPTDRCNSDGSTTPLRDRSSSLSSDQQPS